MFLEVEGFVISETPYGETSKILNIITKEYGKIGILAKGCRSMKSIHRSTANLFTYGVFNIMYKENKLSILNSIDIKNSLKNIRSDIVLISYLTYLTDLTNQVLKETSTKNIFDLFISGILKIEEGLDPSVITNILEIKYLDFLGVGINLNECHMCTTKNEIITLDASYGGLICKSCYTNQKIIDLKVLKLLRMYYLVDIKSVTNIKIDANIKKEINLFLNIYYDSYTGLYLNSKKFLEKLVKEN